MKLLNGDWPGRIEKMAYEDQAVVDKKAEEKPEPVPVPEPEPEPEAVVDKNAEAEAIENAEAEEMVALVRTPAHPVPGSPESR